MDGFFVNLNLVHITRIYDVCVCVCSDIETYDVDTQANKVTVTGNVTTEEVIRALHKIGKQASTWDQYSSNPN